VLHVKRKRAAGQWGVYTHAAHSAVASRKVPTAASLAKLEAGIKGSDASITAVIEWTTTLGGGV